MSTMRELSREMMKIGIIDEMTEEIMESLEPEELEEEAQVLVYYACAISNVYYEFWDLSYT